MGDAPSFAALLDRYRRARGYTFDRLERETGIRKQTIHYWRSQGSVTPYYRDYLLRVAAALDLRRVETERLLRAAGLPPLDTLLATDTIGDHAALFARWDRRAPTNLPTPLTGLLGRDDAILALGATLCRGDARLLTLTGPGGGGKTRLGLAIADILLDAFPDGVWFVDLAPLAEPALVIPAIARALGVREGAGEPLAERLAAHLRPLRALLVLDNFEQVVAAAPAVTALLRAAPEVRALVTSRVPLRAYGESLFAVPPFPDPDPGAALPALAAHPAVALFVARARLVDGGFALTGDNAAAVAALCARLDGLPLALELAAARSAAFTPQALLAHFPRRLDLGGDGPRDVPARQQTLRATIAWSHDLLGPDARVLFARLAAFAGGWTADATTAVCGSAGERAVDVPTGLAALRDGSLVGEVTGPDGTPRFAMLETIREYAAERLATCGEDEAIRARHAAYFLALVESAAPSLAGPPQAAWFDRLEREHDNLRAALRRSLDRADGATALRLGAAAWPFWHERGHLDEGRRWLDDALTLGGTAPVAARVAALDGAAKLAHRQNDYARARAASEEGYALCEGTGDRRGLAAMLINLGLGADRQRDFARARPLYERALALFRAVGDERGVADALQRLAWLALFANDHDEAARLGEACLALHRAQGDTAHIATALTALGLVALFRGEHRRAAALQAESARLHRTVGEVWGLSVSLMNQGLAILLQGEAGAAADLFRESLVLQGTLRDRTIIAYCLDGLAGSAGLLRRPLRAARLAGAAEALREAIGKDLSPAEQGVRATILAAARAHLDDEAAFAATWGAGRAMTLDQLIAEGLETTAQA